MQIILNADDLRPLIQQVVVETLREVLIRKLLDAVAQFG